MRRSRYVTRRTSCSSASPFCVPSKPSTGTRRHPQCPRLHAGRPGQSCHFGSRPLSRAQPGHGTVVLGPRDANQVAAEPAQHLQGTQSRSGLSYSRHRRSNAMGTTGVLLLNTTLTVREHAANSHAKLGWSTLTDYVIERCCQLPSRSSFWHGVALPSRWSKASSPRPARARQPVSSAWPPRTPRRFRPTVPRQNSPLLWGRAPSRQPIGYSNNTARPPSTGLASAKNRYIKNAPDGFPSGAFPIRAK